MTLVDANLLLYAVNTDAPENERVSMWLEEAFSGRHGSVGITWLTLVAFVRIGTHPKAMSRPLTLDEALEQVAEWLALPDVLVIEPGPDHLRHFEAACRSASAKGNLITDAHLAAVALELDCELASCDADFAKFPGLRWINPVSQ